MTPHAATTASAIDAAAATLARGGLVVFPTETLYGLGADASNPAALQHLVDLKGREAGKPILVLISDIAMLNTLVTEIPPLAARLMRRFWPGPLTLVLPAQPSVSEILTGGGDGIGVRLSSHPIATALVRALGRPVTAPSANPAGQPAPVELQQARAYFGDRVDDYLDGGRLHGAPSTVADVRGELQVIREGAIAMEDLHATLREPE